MEMAFEPSQEMVRAGVEALEVANEMTPEELVRFILRAALSVKQPVSA